MSTDTQHPTPSAPPVDVEETLVLPAEQNTNKKAPSSGEGRKASWHDFWHSRKQTWYRRTNTNALFWARLNLIIWTASLLINVGITIYLLVLCLREKDPYARRLRVLWLGSQLTIIWLLTWQ